MSSRRALKLSEQQTLKFVELYRNESLLYDTTMTDYRSRDARFAAVQRIAVQLGVHGFGPEEVIKKFKNLRNAYCQELKRIAESKKKNTDPEDLYYPKVCWFPLMDSFIRPFVEYKKILQLTENSNDTLDDNDNSIEIINDSKEEEPNFEFIDLEYNVEDSSDWPNENSITNNKKRKTSSHVEVPINLSNISFAHHDNSNMSSDTQKTADLLSNQSMPMIAKVEDTYDCFGKYVASLLRETGGQTAYQLQQDIIALIFKNMTKKK